MICYYESMTLICFVKVREKRHRWYRLMCRENIPFIADSLMEFRIEMTMPVIHRRIIIYLTFLLNGERIISSAKSSQFLIQTVLISKIALYFHLHISPMIRTLSTIAKNVQVTNSEYWKFNIPYIIILWWNVLLRQFSFRLSDKFLIKY